MMSLGRERPPPKTTNARTKVFNREIRYKKATTQQSYDNRPNASRCEMKKVWWGRNKKPIWKLCQLGKKCCAIRCFFRSSSAYMCQDPRIARAYTAQNTKIYALLACLACLAQPTYPIPAGCGTDTARRGGLSRPPKTALERSYLAENSSSENRILRPRRKKLLPGSPPQRMIMHIYTYTYRYLLRQRTRYLDTNLTWTQRCCRARSPTHRVEGGG